MIKLYSFFFEDNIKKNLKYIYSFFFGFLFVFCFPPYNFWPLLFPSLIFLFFKSYYASSNKDAFLIGLFFGISFFIFSLHWIFNSFLIRSGIYLYLLPISLFTMSCFLALFISFVTLLTYKFKTKLMYSVVFFSIFWTLSEILRGYVFTGFPWNLLAHSLVNFNSIIQICSILGVYGLSFLLILFVLSSSLIFFKLNQKKNFFFFAISLSLFFIIIVYGNNRINNLNIESFNSSTFRVVQPNINQEDKLNYLKTESNYEKLLKLSFINKIGSLNRSENLIILWPETALINIDHIHSFEIFKKIKSNLKNNEYIISGAFRIEKNKKNKYYNSIVIIDKKLSENFVYDKIHLVPFGEYTPFGNLFNKIGLNFSGLQKGLNSKKIVKYKNIPNFIPLICYEIIFPGKYTNNKNKSSFLLNLTNDAWFGSTIGPNQHFVNSVFRSIEEGKQIIRVANTGISASIDPLGRTMQKIDLNLEGYFDTKIFLIKKNNTIIQTIYNKYGNNLIVILLIILFFLFCILKYNLSNKRVNN